MVLLFKEGWPFFTNHQAVSGGYLCPQQISASAHPANHLLSPAPA